MLVSKVFVVDAVVVGIVGDGVLVGFAEPFFGMGAFGCGGEAMDATMDAKGREESLVAEAESMKGESFGRGGETRENTDSMDECMNKTTGTQAECNLSS